jgi:hypothetical protein
MQPATSIIAARYDGFGERSRGKDAMNNTTRSIVASTSMIGILAFLPAQSSRAQEDPNPRIWSHSYWQEMAQLGLVPFNTAAPDPAPIFMGPELAIPFDLPDVPITTAGNTTQSENSIFIHPMNSNMLLNSNNSSDWPVSQIFGASHFESFTRGQTWQGSVQGTGGTNRGDPATAINWNGRLIVGFIAANSGQAIAYSDNDGASYTTVQVAPNPGQLADKNHLWVDNSAASPFEFNLYDAWTDFGGVNNNRIVVSRSTNNGLTWSPRVNISAAVASGSHDQGVNLQTAPNGNVYAVWAVYDAFPAPEVALGFARSLDGGANWQPAQRIITNIRGIRSQAPGGGLGGSKTMRTASFPSMTVDPQGVIYVVWANYGVPGVNTGDAEIYMIRSTNAGVSWSAPIRVNQDAIGNGRDQWFPWIAADPETGDLLCAFYDSRNFAANNMAETFVAVSRNGGTTWQDFRVSDAAWPADGIVGFGGNYAGDYIGIDVQDREVYPVWSDNRSGNMLAYVSPLQLRGPDGLGVVRVSGANLSWLFDGDRDGTQDDQLNFGASSDTPVAGRWSGSAEDGIGALAPINGGCGIFVHEWRLDDTRDGAVDETVIYGLSTDTPVVGDWDDDGDDDIALFRDNAGVGAWSLDFNRDGTVDQNVNFGAGTDIPVAGDWNGDGQTGIGAVGPVDAGCGIFLHQWKLDNNRDGVVDETVNFGLSADVPVVGDWDGSGDDDIGAFGSATGPTQWKLDHDRNGQAEELVAFGDAATDSPVVGSW